jgi:hypothetical protein
MEINVSSLPVLLEKTKNILVIPYRDLVDPSTQVQEAINQGCVILALVNEKNLSVKESPTDHLLDKVKPFLEERGFPAKQFGFSFNSYKHFSEDDHIAYYKYMASVNDVTLFGGEEPKEIGIPMGKNTLYQFS